MHKIQNQIFCPEHQFPDPRLHFQFSVDQSDRFNKSLQPYWWKKYLGVQKTFKWIKLFKICIYTNIASINISDALSVNDYFADFISQFSTTLEIHAFNRKLTRKEKKKTKNQAMVVKRNSNFNKIQEQIIPTIP